MAYRFRLTVASKAKGVFGFDTQQTNITVSDGTCIILTARNSDVLSQATKFHFEAKGFSDEASAREAGEKLRLRLRILNAMLGLGLNVPITDSKSGGVSASIKDEISQKYGGVIVDSIWGLSVFPDDDNYFEYFMSGSLEVFPSDPSYTLKALDALWSVDVKLDQPSEDALHILGLATRETSEKAAFLANYLALEPLVPRNNRSDKAIELLKKFQIVVSQSLDEHEAASLNGALAHLREESFRRALMRLIERFNLLTHIKGRPVKQFLSDCIETRNRIAHSADIDASTNLSELSSGLREIILTLIWTLNRIPSVSVDVPASKVSTSAQEFSLRVL
jgi:hypothetical protein